MDFLTILDQILILVGGFVLLIKGADWFVDGASAIAEKFGIPQIVIGLTIVAMGTSLPEAAVSITAATSNSSSIAIGNVLGSNILNVLLILGICSVVSPLLIKKNTLYIEIPFVIIISVALLLMGAFDKNIGRLDGVILILFFIAFLVYLFFVSKRESSKEMLETPKTEQKPKKLWLLFLMLFVGAVFIILGSNFTVRSAKALALNFGMSESFIGLTIVAFGTSLPELVTSLIAVKKGKVDIAIGNIVGSNIFNILFVLGITSLIKPIIFESLFLVDNLVAIVSAVLLFVAIYFTKNKSLKRVGGGIMTISYMAYFSFLLIKDIF